MTMLDGRVDGVSLPKRWPEIAAFLFMAGTALWTGGSITAAVETNADNIQKAIDAMDKRDDAIMERVVKLEDRRGEVLQQLARIEALVSFRIQQDASDSRRGGMDQGEPR